MWDMNRFEKQLRQWVLESTDHVTEPFAGSDRHRPPESSRMLPTLMAAAGEPNVKEKLAKGMKVGDKTFKVHLDGYNINDALVGKSPSPRHEFSYFNDDGSLVALRYNQW